MSVEKLSRLEAIFGIANQSAARRQLAILSAEHNLTPLEFQMVTRRLWARFPNARAAVQDLRLWQLLANERPTSYVRRPITSDVTLFHDPDVISAKKCLVIGFCGQIQRLMIPTGLFLQLLPSTELDLLVLNDPDRRHFAIGLRNYAADFVQLARRLDNDVNLNSYKNVCSYGTSMGGFVALRCGLMLGTKAISVGGRFPWHVQRLLADEAMPAFDLLCACKASNAVKFVCVYGNRTDDLTAVDHLATMFPVRRVRIHDTTDHNVIFAMWKQGTLRQFYREQFTLV